MQRHPTEFTFKHKKKCNKWPQNIIISFAGAAESFTDVSPTSFIQAVLLEPLLTQLVSAGARMGAQGRFQLPQSLPSSIHLTTKSD